MVFLIGFVFSTTAQAKESKVFEKLESLSKVLSYIETNYIEPVEGDKLLDSAIKGMLADLDPHTVYMPPEVFREMKVDTKGEFGGLGIEIVLKDDVLTVITPIEDTPAEKAGIKAGDRILKIDGTVTKGMTLLDAVKKMRGPRGGKVILTIGRDGEKNPFDIAVRRDTIRIRSVDSELVDDFYGYVRIKSFQEKTGRDLKRHVKRLNQKSGGKLKGILLDLRNNPGGLLDQAVRTADLFLDEGVIVSTMGRKGSFQEVEMAHKEGTQPDLPMITLVNEGSASASEVVAGALQDHNRSIILGAETFGKGSVQSIIDLEDGSGLKLTIAHYYTPKGRSIQALGIKPDIYVSSVPPKKTEVHYLREQDLEGHFETPKGTKTEPKKNKLFKGRIVDLKEDIQLRRALEYLKTWEVFRDRVAKS